ncbi:hypothetical protein Tco_1000343 [Tanacetum coccineum]
MSSDNASSAVTYTSISSNSNGPSWGIPLVNAGELPEMDPYEEHVPVYVPEPEHPKYHVPSDDDIQVEDQPYADDASQTVESPGHIADSESIEEDSINYLDEPKDDDEDPKEDPEEDHTDYPADGKDGDDEPSDDDDDDDNTDDEDEEPIEDEEEEEHLAPANSSMVPVVDHVPSAGDIEVFETNEYDIPEEDMPLRMRFVLTAPLPGCDVAESSVAAAARPPRVADRAEDVGYVRALQASKHKMMTSIEEVNLRVSYQAHVLKRESDDFYTQLHDARTDRRDIRLEIDVGQNRALLARLETLETHMIRMEWQRQSAKDHAVKQMMRTQVLEARARIDTVEDASSSC